MGVSVQRAEQEFCDLVVYKRVHANINRLEGIVVFLHMKQGVNDKLTAWNNDIKTTLDKVEYTCHLIDRNIMVSKQKS